MPVILSLLNHKTLNLSMPSGKRTSDARPEPSQSTPRREKRTLPFWEEMLLRVVWLQLFDLDNRWRPSAGRMESKASKVLVKWVWVNKESWMAMEQHKNGGHDSGFIST